MKPNILFIMTDQQCADALSCAGNPWVRTPALDRLASQGVRFERAYCTHPLCSPARSSLFTGLMPHQTGVSDNSIPFESSIDCLGLGAYLQQAGYRCAYVGRGPVPEQHGFELLGQPDANDPTITPLALDFLADPGEAPFLLAVSYHNPHNICEWARGQNLPETPIPETPDRREWPTLPANFAPAPFEAEAIRWYQQSLLHPYPTRDWSPDEWRRYLYAYYRMVEAVDAEIGALLDGLEAAGRAEDTVVIFTSDHGNGNAAHQWHQKTVLFEECVRVPLIIVDPRDGRQGQVDSQHLISIGLDFFATAADYAGLDRPNGYQGLSLRPLAEGAAVSAWRDHVVVETTLTIQGVPPKPNHNLARAVISERHKYALYPLGRHREQLFDLQSDPGEQVNCADSARYQDQLQRHRQLLAEWKAATGDRCQIPQ